MTKPMMGLGLAAAVALGGCRMDKCGRDGAVNAAPSVASFCEKARRGEHLAVAFFGGSLTWGANATDPNRRSWRGRIMQRLEAEYPNARFKFVDAAIGGTDSQLGIFRLDRDVTAYNPDLLFVEWAVNDNAYGAGNNQSCSYEGVLRRVLERVPGCVPVQVILPVRQTILEPDEKKLTRRAEHIMVGDKFNLARADVLGEMRKLHLAGKSDLERMWPALIGDNVHPHDWGYGVYADIIWNAVFKSPSAKTPVVPDEWIFAPKYRHVVRANAAELEKFPRGWHRDYCAMRAGTFDFLCSRWQDGLAVAANCAFDAKTGKRVLTPETDVETLKAVFRGEVLMIYGESAVQSGECEIHVDGKRVAKRDTADFGKVFSPSAYLVWQIGDSFDKGKEHELEIRPVFKDGEPQEFRLGSVCVAGRDAACVKFRQ